MMTVPQAFEMALQHHHAGRLAEAETLYRQILAVQPQHADSLNLLGVIAHQLGRNDQAVELMRQAITLQPNDAGANSNLGIVLAELGCVDEAIAVLRRALEINPRQPVAFSNLGNVLRMRGRLDEAVTACRRALEFDPNRPETYNNLGNALSDQGKLEEAIAAYQRAITLQPDFVEAFNNLGTALADQRRLDESVAAYRRALELQPAHAGANNNLANVLRDQGRFDEAIAAYRRVLVMKPGDASAHSNLIYTLHFYPTEEGSVIAEEQRRWNERFNIPRPQVAAWGDRDRNPERRLRIGYVSPDFRDHVVGRNLLPLFRQHNQQSFDLVCYSGVMQPDSVTAEFRRLAGIWRSTVGVTDEALAEMIRQDGVDILVDLTQHMAGNRLPVFARQSAPVQVSFAGYPEGTGIGAIRYRISDRYLESEIEDWRTGERVFLIDSFWCYDLFGMEVAVDEMPTKTQGHITFGSLNNFCKVNEPLLKLWARVLRAVPDSRLVILSGFGSHRQHAVELLNAEGIATQWVEFVEPRPRKEYLELYRRLDLVLDSYPYNGHTTSLDALWMGAPVVSLVGECPVSRAGLSQLSNLGLPELVAHSEEEYVDIATRLANDVPRLEELRRRLRRRMETSVLMDAPRFARDIETAFRAMWRRWCEEAGS